MSWNLLCPGCGGVLDAAGSLRLLDKASYYCALCAGGYEPTLDEMVEVSFTVNEGVRRIAAHAPETLPFWEYQRQVFWSSGIRLPDGEAFEALKTDVSLEAEEIPPGGKCILSVHLPAAFIILFDAVTHTAFFLDCKGEPTRERRDLAVVFSESHPPTGTRELAPGPLRLTLENRTDRRVLPGLYLANDALHHMLGQRKRFLTARDLLSTQTFRDLYRTDTLDMNQRLKITSLTFLFTDLKGSTELYERVGDLVAYDLVRDHFRVLHDVVAARSGAVVKTIGDAVMATFPTPDRGLDAALGMREAMAELNAARGQEDLLVKIGLHEGPCLAVTLNERLDYFGQTVNIAARVQGLAMDHAIFTTEPVVTHAAASRLLHQRSLVPRPQRATLKGIREELTVYEIP
jgi:class 3 adenylate cyclase